MRNFVKIDEKWSVSYDEEDNDRPSYWWRYDEPAREFDRQNNATVAMLYALKSAQERIALLEEKFGIAYQVAGRLIDDKEQPELVKLLDMLCDPDGDAWESEQ